MNEENLKPRGKTLSRRREARGKGFFISGVARWAARGLLLGVGLWALAAIAATYTETFTTSSNYTFDGNKVQLLNGTAQLKLYKPFYLYDTKTEFDAGTYSDTEFHPNDVGANQSGIKTSDSGLIGYWPLNGTAGSIANGATVGLTDSKGTNNGTANNVNGTGMAFVSGRFGNGVSFDGLDDYVNIPHASPLDPSTNVWSISIWVKSGVGNRAILSKGAVGASGYTLKLDGSGYPVLVKEGVTGGILTGTSSVTDNAWHHVAAVASGSGMFLYIDGAQNATSANSSNFVAQAAALTLGKSSAFGSNFNGTLDEVAVFNRILLAAEVAAQYSAGARVHMKAAVTPHAPKLVPGMPGLVAYWSLDASSGTTATDLAGANKGTLTNFPANPWVAGVNGKGLAFDGVDDFVNTANPSGLNPSTNVWSISIWVKSGTGNRVILSKGAVGTNGYTLRMDGSGYPVFVKEGVTGGTLTGTSSVTDNAWHHVAAVASGSGMFLYIDGAQNATSANSSNFVAQTAALMLGKSSAFGSNFNGTLDEVAVFNRILLAAEVAYLAGSKGQTAAYTGPVMDGEISSPTWDGIGAGLNVNVSSGTSGMPLSWGATGSYSGASGGVPGARALATGDFDGDGRVDLVAGGNNASTPVIKWYQNTGDYTQDIKFTPFSISTTRNAVGLAVGDLDGDGKLDFVAADRAGGAVVWFKNNGGSPPTFTDQVAIESAANPTAVAVVDINGDGYPDVIAGFDNGANKIRCYFNNGSGTFTGQDVVTSFSCQHLAVGDVNGDGFPDIVAVSNTGNTIAWFKGDGGNTWVRTNVTTTFTGVYYVGVGDLDGDGDLDITAAGNGNNRISWFVNEGSASPTFSTEKSLSSTYTGASIALPFDLNGDGRLDLLTANLGGKMDLWVNNGNGSFTQQALQNTNDSPIACAIADFNGDGVQDYAIVSNSNGYLDVFSANPFKRKYVGPSTPGATSYKDSKAVDLDGDGFPDILLGLDDGTGTYQGLYWQKGSGDGTLSNRLDIQTFYPGVTKIGAADIDNDGKMDVVAASAVGIEWWKGDGGSSWTKQTPPIVSNYTGVNFLGLADMNNDGFLDIIVSTAGPTGEIAIFKGDGGTSWTKVVVQSVYDGNKWLQVADIDGDGLPDIACAVTISANNTANEIAWWRQNPIGTFTKQTPIDNGVTSSGLTPSGLRLLDLDGDGLLDFVSASNAWPYKLYWWRQTSPRIFGTKTALGSCGSSAAETFDVADIDGDGDFDFVSTQTDYFSLLLNDGSQNFSSQNFSRVMFLNTWRVSGERIQGGNCFLADMNGDGLRDIVIIPLGAGTTSPICIYVQNPTAKVQLQARTDTSTPLTTSFVGPDNTASTYFDSGGGILSPLDGKRYGQYKAFLYRNDTTVDPQIKNVQVNYSALPYTNTNPWIAPNIGQSFTYLTNFTETATKPASTELKYSLSPDNGATWYYHNGSNWVTSDGSYPQSATASVINSNIAGFDDKAYNDGKLPANSTGTLLFRAFLSSDGNNTPQLDKLDVGYETGSITVSAPNGSENWKVGEVRNVTWATTGTVPTDLAIEYSTDASHAIWTAVSPAPTAGQISAKSYPWTIPNAVSATGQVRIWSSSVPAVRDSSNADFRIYKLSVTSPNGGESWPASSSQTITWTQNGLPGSTVKLLLSTDGGATYGTTIATGISKSAGTYAWTVPNTLTTQGRVKIVDESNSAVFDESDANFTIGGSVITVDQPTGSSAWPVTTTQKIKWSVAGPIPTGGTLKISYSTDNGTTYTTAVDGDAVNATTGSTGFDWAVPLDAASPTAKIEVKDSPSWDTLGGQSAVDGVSPTFKITAKVTVTAPNGGEKWAAGSAHNIRWQTLGSVGNVDILADLDNNGTFETTLFSNVANDGSEAWTPTTAQASAAAKIRVQDHVDAATQDVSDATFKISQVTVTAPNAAGMRWQAGVSKTITWTSTSVNNVKLEYSTDNGANYTTIASSTASDGTEGWTVALKSTTTALIRISDADSPTTNESGDTAVATDTSDNPFAIYGAITVTVPNGGEDWASGQSQVMNWTISPADPNVVQSVKITITDQVNSANNKTIVASTNGQNVAAGSGSFSWTPDFATTAAKIKVSDTGDPVSSDQSNNSFSISGISITAPAGGEKWVVGDTNRGISISWSGALSSVKLEYSFDNGATWKLIQGVWNPPANPSTFAWTPIPDDIADNKIRVKITNNSNANVYAISNAFTITGALSITTPPTLVVGDTATISWTKTGTINNSQTLEFSPGGAFAGDVQTLGANLSGTSFDWTVPDNIGTAGKLRVTDTVVGHPATSSTSSAFAIQGKLAFTSPMTPDRWASLSPQTSAWMTSGTIGTVSLDYSTDGGTTYTALAGGTNISNNGSLSVTVPDVVTTPQTTPTKSVRLRIQDSSAGHTGAAQASATVDLTVLWYKIIWDVKDLANKSLLGALSVNDVSITPNWVNTANSLFAPVNRYYPYGTFTTSWSKSGYNDATLAGWQAATDGQRNVIYMENLSTSLIPVKVNVQADYLPGTSDAFVINSWVVRRGDTVTDPLLLTGATVEIWDDATLVKAMTSTAPDPNGIFHLRWDSTGLVGGKVYFVRSAITYNNGVYTDGGTVNTYVPLKVSEVSPAIAAAKTDILGQIGTATDTSAAATLFGKVAETKEKVIQQIVTVNTAVQGVQNTLGTVADVAGTKTVVGKIEDVKKVLGPGMITDTGPAASPAPSAPPLPENAGTVLGRLEKTENQIEELSKKVTGAGGAGGGGTVDLGPVLKQLGDIQNLLKGGGGQGALGDIQRQLGEVRAQLGSLDNPQSRKPIMDELNGISLLLRKMAPSLGSLLDINRGTAKDVKDVANTIGRMKVAVALILQLEESRSVKVVNMLEYGSIILRILVVNPTDQPQTVPVKAYLPKEVREEHILNKEGEIELVYDAIRGAYYVSATAALKPNESMVYMVECEDIWLISKERMSRLSLEGKATAEGLKGSEYEKRSSDLSGQIDLKMKEIGTRQSDPTLTPEQHIQVYREDLEIFSQLEKELVLLKQLAASLLRPGQRGEAPGALFFGKGAAANLSTAATWRLIFGLLIFVGLMSLFAFLLWQRQAHLAMKADIIALEHGKNLKEEGGGGGDHGSGTDDKPLGSAA